MHTQTHPIKGKQPVRPVRAEKKGINNSEAFRRPPFEEESLKYGAEGNIDERIKRYTDRTVEALLAGATENGKDKISFYPLIQNEESKELYLMVDTGYVLDVAKNATQELETSLIEAFRYLAEKAKERFGMEEVYIVITDKVIEEVYNNKGQLSTNQRREFAEVIGKSYPHLKILRSSDLGKYTEEEFQALNGLLSEIMRRASPHNNERVGPGETSLIYYALELQDLGNFTAVTGDSDVKVLSEQMDEVKKRWASVSEELRKRTSIPSTN